MRKNNILSISGLRMEYKQISDSWQLEPGFHVECILTISPNGDKELRKETKEIVSFAPAINGWEFYYAKQPIQSGLNFVLYQDDGLFHFSAEDWEYVLLGFPDNTFDMIIKADSLTGLEKKDQLLAIELALDTIIGEEKKIELILGVDLITDIPEEYQKNASKFKSLFNHFKQFLRSEL